MKIKRLSDFESVFYPLSLSQKNDLFLRQLGFSVYRCWAPIIASAPKQFGFLYDELTPCRDERKQCLKLCAFRAVMKCLSSPNTNKRLELAADIQAAEHLHGLLLMRAGRIPVPPLIVMLIIIRDGIDQLKIGRRRVRKRFRSNLEKALLFQ